MMQNIAFRGAPVLCAERAAGRPLSWALQFLLRPDGEWMQSQFPSVVVDQVIPEDAKSSFPEIDNVTPQERIPSRPGERGDAKRRR